LSGHTHGAQIRFSPFGRTGPLDIFWWLDRINRNRPSPYRQGLFRVRGSLLYTGNGLGTTSLRMRFMAPPEIAIFTLLTGDGDSTRSCDNPRRYVLSYAEERRWNGVRVE
jgi:predicted MPP superfamily phosphohydrolase